MDNDLHTRFDALVSGLEDELAQARARGVQRARRRFIRWSVIGGAATLGVGLWNPFMGVACFLATVLGAHRALLEAD